MTPEQRLLYLDAMGIQVWLPNDAVAADGVVVEVASPVEEAVAEVAPVAPPVSAPPVESPAPPAPPPFMEEPPAWDEPPPWYDEAAMPPPSAPPPMARNAPRSAPPSPPPRPAPAAPRQRPAPPPVPEPRRSVGASVGWESLESMVRDCTRCELHRSRTHPVFGVGDRNATWMVVGEAPGHDEDLQGEPFVGRAGKLLNAMLWAAGFAREQVYIANVLKSRPPNNRDPRPDEVEVCIPYLLRQIELIQPRVILAVGRVAAQNLLQTDEAIGRLRGRVHTLRPYGIPVVATYHPAYLLRTPSQKRRAWDDLKLALRVHGAG
ncbi:uracil-DNA glycosylase [Endothiovibrio diazotrophicus]